MGFLSGLLDNVIEKKHCDICGNETGRIFGNNKLVDGNMCDECVGKLSPFFKGRSKATLADIYGQLQYRKENEQRLEGFRPTRTLGGDSSWKVVLDEAARCLIVVSSTDWRSSNPDIISFDQLDGCDVWIDEDKDEQYTTDPEGKWVSYDPPRYEYSYDFNVTLHVNTPYFESISFKVNGSHIDRKYSEKYTEAEVAMHTIKNALDAARTGEPEEQFVPERPKFVPNPMPVPRPAPRPAAPVPGRSAQPAPGRSAQPAPEADPAIKRAFGNMGDKLREQARPDEPDPRGPFGDLGRFGKR